MRTKLLALPALLLLILAFVSPVTGSPAAGSPAAGSPAAGDTLDEVPGTIKKVSEKWYAIVPDEDTGTRYAPDKLPKDFRRDGLRVVFSGVVGALPPGRVWGIPLKLTQLRLSTDESDVHAP